MDFKSLTLRPDDGSRDSDPLAVFAEAVQRGPIEQLRGPQQEALKAWHHKHRHHSDVLFSLDTGGGKSLVGLLAAQSLCNETRRPVIYMCPSIVLVEQIAKQAVDAGLAVDTYVRSEHSDAARFFSALIPCVTTYHAVFNGKSTFRELRLGGAVFDDSHVAESVIRQCFTCAVTRSSAVFTELSQFCHGAFRGTPFETECAKRLTGTAGRDQVPMLVPAFYVYENATALADILSAASNDQELQFAVPHLVDRAPQLMCLVGTGVIELTPWTLPVHGTLPFNACEHRLYLSATLPSARSFVRAFGRRPSVRIEPEGKTNAAQRVFVIPPPRHLQARRQFALDMLKQRRAAVLVPSNAQAKDWEVVGTRLPRGSGAEVLEEFGRSPAGRLVLVARYDGLDLPGDMCKALIVEGLPRKENLSEQFFASVLQLRDERSRRIADRLTQGLGRIFRSNRDHGVVVLTDTVLEAWLRQTDKAAFLPGLLQRQLQLSFALADRLGEEATPEQWSEILGQIIDGDEGWDEFYKREIAKLEAEEIPETVDLLEEVVIAEAEIGAACWEHQYGGARKRLDELIQHGGDELSAGHTAWLHHMAGLVAQMDHDEAAAQEHYDAAHGLQSRLLRRRNSALTRELSGDVSASEQARRAAARMTGDWKRDLAEITGSLRGTGGHKGEEHSAALVALGELLGLHARGADKETGGKGPDAVWQSPDASSAMSIEAKTQKQETSIYSKSEIAQSISSQQWVREEYVVEQVIPIIIGPQTGVAEQASPPTGLRIVELADIIGVAVRLRSALELAERHLGKGNLYAFVEEALRLDGLKYGDLSVGLPGVLAEDLRDQ